MNADLLAQGSSAFYMRGTTGERVPTTVVGLSSFLECVAISYERSRCTQYYHDCPVARPTFPIVRADSLDSDRGPSPPPPVDVGGAAPTAPGVDAGVEWSVLRPSTLRRRRYCHKMATIMRCLCWAVPQRVIITTALLSENVVQ